MVSRYILSRFRGVAVFILLVSCSTFSSCSCDDSSSDRTIDEPPVAGGWTVMVWLDADNNLEWSALEDFNEMEYGLYLAGLTDPDVTGKIKIIVQVDRHGGYDNNSGYTGNNWYDTRRYIIRPDPDNSDAWTSRRIDNNMGEANMGDAAALKDFIEYCHEHFTADNYALILWNHGGGLQKKKVSYTAPAGVIRENPWKEICIDETDSADALYTGEITDVLTSAHSVKFLGLDACLMAMVEVAYEYRPGVEGKFGADAICFSPASEQSDGWDYERILMRLGGAGNTDAEGDPCYSAANITAQQFAALCAKEYADFFGTTSGSQTQTAVDNTLVNDVKARMDAFAAAISGISGYKSYVEAIRGSGASAVTMHYFNDASTGEWLDFPFFDLYDFAERVAAESTLTDAADEAAALMTSIKSFILYSYGQDDYSGFTQGENGLSFFFTDGDAVYNSSIYMAYQWWYTSLATASVEAGKLYGRLDFCEKGTTDGTVENWYELIMAMYMTPSLLSEKYWPDPAY